MAYKRFTGWDVAIWFHPPTADNAPTSFLHALLDLGKHSWVRFLYPLVERCRAGNEDKVWIFIHPIESRTKGGFNLMKALLPLPQPYGINVGVADHMKFACFQNVLLNHWIKLF